jgi:hypothetical protein
VERCGLQGLGDVPDVLHAITGHVPGLLVLDEGVQRLAVVGPLHRTVVTLDLRPLAFGLFAGLTINGGQFFAQSPLHIDLPPASLSKVYRVMPL